MRPAAISPRSPLRSDAEHGEHLRIDFIPPTRLQAPRPVQLSSSVTLEACVHLRGDHAQGAP
jgi:hypothetical protein